MYNSDAILGALKPAGKNTSLFLSNRFSLHNLFSYMLSITGPAIVRISTFSLCEAAINNFVHHAAAGDIVESYVLLDLSLAKRDINKLIFANNVLSNIRMTDNHSKLIILFSTTPGDDDIMFIGSANFNDNRKFESGLLSTDPTLVHAAAIAFDELFNNSMPLQL